MNSRATKASRVGGWIAVSSIAVIVLLIGALIGRYVSSLAGPDGHNESEIVNTLAVSSSISTRMYSASWSIPEAQFAAFMRNEEIQSEAMRDAVVTIVQNCQGLYADGWKLVDIGDVTAVGNPRIVHFAPANVNIRIQAEGQDMAYRVTLTAAVWGRLKPNKTE